MTQKAQARRRTRRIWRDDSAMEGTYDLLRKVIGKGSSPAPKIPDACKVLPKKPPASKE